MCAREPRGRPRSRPCTPPASCNTSIAIPDDFSGGQQQRIAIARAIVGERKLVLADEPTGSLDTVNSDHIVEMLAGLPARIGTAVVLVTHEPRFASWADRVVFLRDGLVVDETSTRFDDGTPRASPFDVASVYS
ncbi:hypothetical protein BH24ACT5_BH24ACT5_23090 [soil metagenome]